MKKKRKKQKRRLVVEPTAQVRCATARTLRVETVAGPGGELRLNGLDENGCWTPLVIIWPDGTGETLDNCGITWRRHD